MVDIGGNTPKQGQFIWLDFGPTKGSEQSGRRPALVLSHDIFNKSGMAMICPVTTKLKGY